MSFNIRNLKKLKKSFSLDKNQDQSQKLQLNSSHHNSNSENRTNENQNHQKLKRLASYEKVIRNEIAKLKNHNRSNNNLDIKAVEDIDDFHFLSDTGAVSNEKMKMGNQKQDEKPRSPTRSKNDADRQTLKSLSIGENLLARLRDKTNASNNNNTSSNTSASDNAHHKDRRISAISKISKDSFMTANSHMTANSAISFRNPDISLNNDLLRLQEELKTLNRFSKKSLARSKTLEMEKAYSIIALNRSTCASNPSIDAIHGNQNCLLENPNPNSNANVNYNHNDQVGLHRDKTISRESANTLHSNSNSVSVIRNVNHTSDGVNLQHAHQHNNSINKSKSKKIKDCHHQTQNSCGPTPKRLFSENSFKFPPLGIPEISVPATLEHIGMSRRDKKNNNNHNNHPNGRNYASHTTNRCGGRNDQNDSINGYYNNDDRDFVDNFFDCSPLQNSCGVGLNRKSSFTKKMDFLRVKDSCAANDRNQQNYESAQETRNTKSVIRRSESLYESAQPTNRLSQKSKLNRSSSNKISRKELSSSSRRMRTGTVEALNPSHQNSGDEAIIAKDIAKIRTKKLLQRNVSLPNPEKSNSLKTPVYAIPDLTMNKPTPQDLAALRERHLNHERSASPDEELNNNNQGPANLFGCNVGVSASCAGNANSYYGQICTDGKNENNDESLCNNGPGRRGFPVPSMSSLRTPRGRIKIVGSSKTMPINLSMQLSKERQDSRDQHELASTGPPDSVRGTAGGCTNLVTGPKGNNARDRRISGVSYNSLGMLSDTSNHIHATGNRLNLTSNGRHPPIKNSLSHNTIQENNIYARANETKFQRKPSNKFEDAKAKIRFNRIKSLTDNNPEKHSNSFKITYHNTTNGTEDQEQQQQSQIRKSKQRAQRTQSDQNHNKNKNRNMNLTLKEQSERYSTKQFGEIQQNNPDPNSGSYKIINVSTRKTTRITPADLSSRNINTAPTVHSPTAQNMMHTISQDKAEKIFDEILNHKGSVKSQQSQQSQKQKVYKTRSLGRDGKIRNNSNTVGATRSDNMGRIEEESGVSGGGGGGSGGHIKIQRSRVYSEKRNGQQGAIHVRVARDRSKSTKR